MKRLFTLFAFIFFAQFAIAQNASKAKSFLKEKNFDKAIEAIDLAIKDPKQSTKAEVWYTRLDLYMTMLESQDESIRNKEPKAMQYVKESEAKVLELEQGKGTYTTRMNISIPGVSTSVKDRIYAYLFNAAVNAQGEPEIAYGYFAQLVEIFPDDMISSRYATRFAFMADKDEDAIKLAKKFVSNKIFADSLYVISEMYQFGIMAAERSEKKEEASTMIEAAMAKFPKESFFLNRKINALIGEKKYEEAINYLKAGLELAKEDEAKAMYMVNLGVLNQDLKKNDEAVKYFEETLKIEPKNYTANFSMGAYHYNKGAELANTLKVNELDKSHPKMKEVLGHYKNAIPYFEAAHKADQTKVQVFNPLWVVYKEVYGEADERTKTMRAKLNELMKDDE